MKGVVKLSKKLITLSMYLGIISTLALMLLVVINIVLRKFFAYSILGSVELTQQLLVCIIWFGMPVCALHGEMMTVDIFKFPGKYLRIIDTITFFISTVSGIAAIKGAWSAYQTNASTTQLHLPKFIFQYITGIGFLLVALAVFINFIVAVKPEISGNETWSENSKAPDGLPAGNKEVE